MSLSPGSRLGAYEILALIGQGGMGTVYRARDTRLHRDVAVKVLPDALTSDPTRVARFRREAQVLASINHPQIGAILGLEETEGRTALVLELVDGPTLAERIARGRLPLDEAIEIAAQIAEALEAAHDNGIVHRDLKPENIKIKADGTVKVLDFGIAKAVDPNAHAGAEAPTITVSMTEAGAVLGTAAYMSPEQARGQSVDKRTDIWAFGCVLFEMLTGTRAFPGGDMADVAAAVLRAEPDWRALPSDPSAVAGILRRCLEKDPRRRFRDIADVRLLLETAPPVAVAAAQPRSAGRWWMLAAGLFVGALAGAGTYALLGRGPEMAARLQRFQLTTSAALPVSADPYRMNVAIAPDGSRVVYSSSAGGASQLVARRLDEIEGTLIAGAEGGFDPFFSADGRRIGFATFTALKSVGASGGPTSTICPVDAYFSGASWGADDTIVFTQQSLGLFRVAASGGAPTLIAKPDLANGERAFVGPVLLPGGRAVLYTDILADGSMRVMARRFDRSDATIVVERGFGAQYLRDSGHLLYGDGSRLMAVRFDLETLQAAGSPVPVQEDVLTKQSQGVANVAVAEDGTVVYVSGRSASGSGRLVWVDRSGTHMGPVIDQALEYPRFVRLSPDGRRLALADGPLGQGQIWIHDLSGATRPLKLTFADHNISPVWSPDGKRLAFLSRTATGDHLLAIAADGSQVEPVPLVDGEIHGLPVSWSRDGALLVFDEPAKQELWLVDVNARTTRQWAPPTPFAEAAARLSPDGHWLAYSSDQTGRTEVWVRAFPEPGPPVRISTEGGRKPLWSNDGREILYENGSKLMAASVRATSPAFHSDPAHVLFEGGFAHDDDDPHTRYTDVAPDGRFLMVESPPAAPAALAVVQHWGLELQRLLPNR